MKTPHTLDPLLAPAMQLEQLPIVSGRAAMDVEARHLVGSLERIAAHAQTERDALSQAQLLNVCEALGVLTISLIAYARGRTPKVASKPPNTNLIVQ